MNASPDRLQPIEAHAVVFERALGLGHSERASRLLRRAGYDVVTVRDSSPLPIRPLVSDPEGASRLVDIWDQGLAQATGPDKPITELGLKAISQSFGLDTGIPAPETEVAAGLNISTRELRETVNMALDGVARYLIHDYLREPGLEQDRAGIEGLMRARIMRDVLFAS